MLCHCLLCYTLLSLRFTLPEFSTVDTLCLVMGNVAMHLMKAKLQMRRSSLAVHLYEIELLYLSTVAVTVLF
jgi:hypothetical protein